MADRPIIFSGAMVRALLDGRKTQTRRLINPAPKMFDAEYDARWRPHVLRPSGSLPDRWSWWEGPAHGPSLYHTWKSLFTAGDRAYVRETWKPHSLYASMKPRDIPPTNVFYAADDRYAPSNTPWVPCIHMPRWASRLTLFVEEVRVQRLQDITEVDAIREGVTLVEGSVEDPREAFALLWDSLHTEPGTRWEGNPWIYALTFRVARGNIDRLERIEAERRQVAVELAVLEREHAIGLGMPTLRGKMLLGEMDRRDAAQRAARGRVA